MNMDVCTFVYMCFLFSNDLCFSEFKFYTLNGRLNDLIHFDTTSSIVFLIVLSDCWLLVYSQLILNSVHYHCWVFLRIQKTFKWLFLKVTPAWFGGFPQSPVPWLLCHSHPFCPALFLDSLMPCSWSYCTDSELIKPSLLLIDLQQGNLDLAGALRKWLLHLAFCHNFFPYVCKFWNIWISE